MNLFRTSFSQIAGRLDVNYYRPCYVENARVLEAAGTLPFGQMYSRSGIGHTASVEPHYEKNGGGVPFISGKAIKSNELLIEVAERIRTDSHVGALSKSQLHPGTLLLVRKGDVGNACVVPFYANELNCSSEVMFFDVKPGVDPHFLAAYFNSTFGAHSVQRLQRGSLIPGVSLYDIPTLEVFWPGESVRKYIGAKVRQAERLREHARALHVEFNKLLSIPAVDEAVATASSKHTSVATSDLDPRLDAKYYDVRAMRVLKATSREAKELGGLIESINNGFEHRTFVEVGTPYITVAEVSSGRLNIDSAPRIPLSVEIPAKALINRKCVLVVRTGSVGVAVKVHAEDANACISSHLIKLSFAEESDATAVTAFLNSQAGRCLLHKISYGAVQPQVGQEELLKLPIPEAILASKAVFLQLTDASEASLRAAQRLTRSAKLLVEALIEGRVMEAELKEAQEGLERGDASADRELLSRLARKGIDVAGEPPLFPDLDALYETLEQASEVAVA